MSNAEELSFQESPVEAAPTVSNEPSIAVPATQPLNRLVGLGVVNDYATYAPSYDPKPAIEPAQRVVANPTGRCAVLDGTGHTELSWDTRDPDSVKAAKEKFDELLSRRYLAFKVNDDGSKGEQIRAFDPEIEDMILIPQMAGG
jgi:hypothetical protein